MPVDALHAVTLDQLTRSWSCSSCGEDSNNTHTAASANGCSAGHQPKTAALRYKSGTDTTHLRTLPPAGQRPAASCLRAPGKPKSCMTVVLGPKGSYAARHQYLAAIKIAQHLDQSFHQALGTGASLQATTARRFSHGAPEAPAVTSSSAMSAHQRINTPSGTATAPLQGKHTSRAPVQAHLAHCTEQQPVTRQGAAVDTRSSVNSKQLQGAQTPTASSYSRLQQQQQQHQQHAKLAQSAPEIAQECAAQHRSQKPEHWTHTFAAECMQQERVAGVAQSKVARMQRFRQWSWESVLEASSICVAQLEGTATEVFKISQQLLSIGEQQNCSNQVPLRNHYQRCQ